MGIDTTPGTSAAAAGSSVAVSGTGTAAPDLAAVKQRQQVAWTSGDYAFIGVRLQIVGETLAEAADLRAGERVLDVAAGNGNATLAAARRFAEVVSTDYVPQLLEKGAARARADGLEIDFRVADVEALPFGDASFDAVLSTFGAMFAPDHERTAAEMLRVLRPGGRIGLASWTPESFVGEVFRCLGRHVPPPAGVRSPMLWGTGAHLERLFGPQASTMRCESRTYAFRYRSAEHWIEVFRAYYGPAHKAFESLDQAGRERLTADLGEVVRRHDTGAGRGLVVPAEYLEAVIVKR